MKRASHTPPSPCPRSPRAPQFRSFLASRLKFGRRTCPCDAREGRGKPGVGMFCQSWGPGPGARSPLTPPPHPQLCFLHFPSVRLSCCFSRFFQPSSFFPLSSDLGSSRLALNTHWLCPWPGVPFPSFCGWPQLKSCLLQEACPDLPRVNICREHSDIFLFSHTCVYVFNLSHPNKM